MAGRDQLVERFRRRLTSGVPVHHLFTGPRGVGKTVLLRDFEEWAREDLDWVVVRHQLAETQDISSSLAGELVAQTQRLAPLWERFTRHLARRLTVGVTMGVHVRKELTPETEPLAPDVLLTGTLTALGRAARDQRIAVLLLLDEFHAPRPGPELVRLSQALQAVNTDGLPVHMLAAGLRPLAGTRTEGATFIERLGTTPIELLDPDATRLALLEPLARHSIAITTDALDRLVATARGYPYFIQLFGFHAWETWLERGAEGPITDADVDAGLQAARHQVDALYRGRFERLSKPAQRFVLAMAELTGAGQGDVGISDVATRLERTLTSLSTIRQTLIEQHQLIEPTSRGRLRFTLPWYAQWLRTDAIDQHDVSDAVPELDFARDDPP
jgi:hypothetical protein